MPRKRLPLISNQPLVVKITNKKVGRPRKKKVTEFADASIMPVANGYVVQTTSASGELYVFPEIDEAFEFIKDRLKSTTEQKQFIDNV